MIERGQTGLYDSDLWRAICDDCGRVSEEGYAFKLQLRTAMFSKGWRTHVQTGFGMAVEHHTCPKCLTKQPSETEALEESEDPDERLGR